MGKMCSGSKYKKTTSSLIHPCATMKVLQVLLQNNKHVSSRPAVQP